MMENFQVDLYLTGFFFGFKWEKVILHDAVPAQSQKERRTVGTEEQPFLNVACYRFMLCERVALPRIVAVEKEIY